MPQELYKELIDRLARLRRKKESLELGVALCLSLGLSVLLATAIILLEAAFHWSIAGRTAAFFLGFGISLAIASFFSLHPLLVYFGFSKRTTDDDLARAIGQKYDAVRDRLVNAVQLVRPLFATSQERSFSNALAFANFESTYRSARQVDFNAILDERPLKKIVVFLLMSVVTSALLFAVFPTDMTSAAGRLIHFRTFYQKPAPFVLIVKPGNVRALRGDSVTIAIETRGEQLAQVNLHLRQDGQKEFDVISLHSFPDSTHGSRILKFIYALRADHPVQYYAEARDIESERFKVTVLDHPIVRSLRVVVQPPAYTGQKAVALDENIGDVSGVTGTRASFTIRSSKKLKSAIVTFQATPAAANDSAHLSPKISPKQFSFAIQDSIATGAITFLSSGSYHIDLLDEDSIWSEHPIEYNVVLTKDLPPTIALIEPGDRSDLPSTLRVNLLARIHDDYGFRGLRLGYRISHSKYAPAEKDYTWRDVPLLGSRDLDQDVGYLWNLTTMSLAPEDEVSYVLEVSDNDAVTGPKFARTPEALLRFPSVKEIFDKADQQSNEAQKNLSEIQQDASEMQKKIDEAVNEMKQMKTQDLAKQSQDFAKQKDVQQMLQRQEQLNKRVEDVAKDLQQMTSQLNQQQALTPETMQKYQELQKLFEQINSPELKKAMENLQHAMQQTDPKALQEAMKNMQFSEDQFKKSIERTTNILKKIQMEQKVDQMMKQSSELAKQEEKAASDAEQKAGQNKQPDEQQKAAAEREQADAKKELDRMRQEMNDLAKEMKKLPEQMQTPEELKAAHEAMNDPSMDQSMEQAGKAGKEGNEMQMSENAKSASNKMKNARSKLSDLKQKMSENEKQRTMRELKQIRDEINKLSKEEEALKNKAQQAQPNSNVFRKMAEEQAAKKEELGQTASRMMQLAQKSTSVTPEMGKSMGQAFSQMQKSEEAMTERDQTGSQQDAKGAMTSLNQAAQQTQSSMNAMQNGGKQPGGKGGSSEQGEGDGSPGGDNPGGEGSGGQSGSAMQQFLNQINQLAQQQQALNQSMQGMQGKQGSAQAQKEMMRQQAEMAKIAAQQQAVQKSVEQLAKEQQDAKNGSKQTGENLQKIADDMQQMISDMKSNGGIKPETIQRQERILSRLLQAERSAHERDKDQARESKSGGNVIRESPRSLDLSSPEAKQALQQELNNARTTGYTSDYNTLIRKYFQELEKTQAK